MSKIKKTIELNEFDVNDMIIDYVGLKYNNQEVKSIKIITDYREDYHVGPNGDYIKKIYIELK